MKKGLVFTFYLLVLIYAKAQNLEEINKKVEKRWLGTVVLKDGQEYSCRFTYNPLMSEGLLIIQTDSLTNVYPPEKIQSFSFFDDETNSERHFYSLPFKPEQTKKYFFELIYESNRISILGSSTIKNKNAKYESRSDLSKLSSTISILQSPSQNKVNRTKVKSDYKKYLVDHGDRQIYPFSRSKFLDMIGDNAEVLNYMYTKHYKLQEEDLYQYIELIDLYAKN